MALGTDRIPCKVVLKDGYGDELKTTVYEGVDKLIKNEPIERIMVEQNSPIKEGHMEGHLMGESSWEGEPLSQHVIQKKRRRKT